MELVPSMYGGNWADTKYGRIGEALGSHIPIVKSGRILDWGCSTGLASEELAQKYPGIEVIGIDDIVGLSKKMKENRRRAKLLIADGYVMPFRDESFEAVFCSNNLYYVARDFNITEAQIIFRELMRVIKKNGYLVVSGATILNYFSESETKEGYEYAIFQRNDKSLLKINAEFLSETNKEREDLEGVIRCADFLNAS